MSRIIIYQQYLPILYTGFKMFIIKNKEYSLFFIKV